MAGDEMQMIRAGICKDLAQQIRHTTAKDNREQLFLNDMEKLCRVAGYGGQDAALSDKQYKWLEDVLMRESQEW